MSNDSSTADDTNEENYDSEDEEEAMQEEEEGQGDDGSDDGQKVAGDETYDVPGDEHDPTSKSNELSKTTGSSDGLLVTKEKIEL